MARTFSIVFIFFYVLLLTSAAQVMGLNAKCPSFPCGSLGQVSFPFSNQTHPECGLFIVNNCTEKYQTIRLARNGPLFYIMRIYQDNTLVLLDQLPLQKLFDDNSCKSFRNLTIPSSSFISFDIQFNQTLFKCPLSLDSIPTNFSLLCNSSGHSIYYNRSSYSAMAPTPPAQCSLIRVLVNKTQNRVDIFNLYTRLFHLQVNVTTECSDCHWKGGRCESDSRGNFHCSNGKTGTAIGLNTKALVAMSASGIGLSIITLVFYFRKKLSFVNIIVFWKKKTKNYRNIEAFLKNCGSLALRRYSYSEIKKMTNLFKHKLGQGGYGGVYKGKLLDGRNVAVKVLNDSKGNGEEFINEMASISRTSHINIVGLFGYCFEDRIRALIYEFVPNGSLEKFIHGQKNPRDKQLKWEKLYQIALGIARGLEYLHRGCSTRILHFDIKPHNILLDEDFCPKISDFGLAKICPRKESIISMTGARGTAGYIAPEVFCRHFGEVSHKSDVYSYGMMVLEMAGGRKNLDVGIGQTSEIYFPHWIFERLEVDEELGLQGIENEEDNECARKMIIVSLWCIQTNPSNRPAMGRVVEMLEGRLDSLQFPPKPFLTSPSSKAADSATSLLW